MSVLCRFHGLVIFMNYNDHNPPHLHARFQGQEVIIQIQSGIVMGVMSMTALRSLCVWTESHRSELMEDWLRAREHRPLLPIPPLP
jgi:hypothetical protein